MSELKTLKDLEMVDCEMVYKSELKAEAVKWVKAFRLKTEWNEYENPKNPWKSPKPNQELKEIPDGTNYMSEIEEWIIKFFNLIEEDLKEVQNENP